ncbi:uncharacterized protein TNCV_4197531 [Trichonephila clavipes]|nr:uncharacterized protein TNCV_4197531 [Trichonephila clavipes]
MRSFTDDGFLSGFIPILVVSRPVKSALKRTGFESVTAGKKKAARVLKELTQKDFQRHFEQWKIRMESYRDRGGVFIEGENSLAVLNHKILEANSQVQNVKLGGHQTCLSINRLWHELCDMLHRLVGITAPGHHDCSIQE